jgi:hypothetical protein
MSIELVHEQVLNKIISCQNSLSMTADMRDVDTRLKLWGTHRTLVIYDTFSINHPYFFSSLFFLQEPGPRHDNPG